MGLQGEEDAVEKKRKRKELKQKKRGDEVDSEDDSGLSEADADGDVQAQGSGPSVDPSALQRWFDQPLFADDPSSVAVPRGAGPSASNEGKAQEAEESSSDSVSSFSDIEDEIEARAAARMLATGP